MQKMGLKIKNSIIHWLIPPIIHWNYHLILSFRNKKVTPTYINKFRTNSTLLRNRNSQNIKKHNFHFKPIIKLKSEWSGATALITEGSQRILDALFNSIKRNHNASVLVYKQGAAPCGHAVDVVFFKNPYVVAKRTRGVDRTTWVGKRVEPE